MHGRGPRLGRGALVLLAVLMVLPWASAALGDSGANPPAVTSEQTLEVGKTTAKVSAMVNPKGAAVTGCEVIYGTTEGSLTSSIPCPSILGAETEVEASATLEGLAPNTTYYFEIVASTAEGTGEGGPISFKTQIANAPVPVTGKAGEVKLASALLEGTVNPEGAPATCKFKYGTEPGSLSSSAPCSTEPGSGTGPEPVSAEVAGLAPETTYYFELIANGEGGEGKGTVEQFTTSADQLAVATGEASAVSKTTATLNGTVNPGGSLVTRCEFEYGTTEGELTSNVKCSALPGEGPEPVKVSAAVTGLAPNTRYYFKLVADNEAAIPGEGAEEQFTTARNPPAVTTGEASGVGQTAATLTGTVNPEGEEIESCAVEYGTTPSLGSSVSCPSLPEAGTGPVTVAVQATGLSPGTTYYYRLVAKSPGGEEVGSVNTFATLAPTPTPVPQPPPGGSPPAPKGPEPAKPPALSSLSESNSIFRVGRASTAPAGRISRVSPIGTVFSFVLDQPAVVTVTFIREESGHMIGKSCVVGRRGAGKPACVRSHVAMMLGRRSRTGLNRLLFTGRVRGRALHPGAYRATFRAESLAGTSAPSSISFRVVAR